MIKRIRFATLAASLAPDEAARPFRAAAAAASEAPPGTRPVRIAVCTMLPELEPGPAHDAIGLEWFIDRAHLGRYETWLGSAHGRPVGEALARALKLDASPVVIAEEVVMRGADWLEQRWRDGGEQLKHMATAKRAPGLTLAEFLEMWQGRAGTVQQPGQTIIIPDVARGKAYIQNRPVPGDWAYDALNEVYFDDLDDLRTRIEFFHVHMTGQAEKDMVSESGFVAAREEPLLIG